MRRLVALLVFVAIVAGGLYIAARVALVPYAEHRLADAIGASLGARVIVTADDSASPGLLTGHVGNLDVRAPYVERSGLVLADFRAHVSDASIDLGRLVRGETVLGFSGIAVRGTLRQGSLQRYLRGALQQAGVPGARRLVLQIQGGDMTLKLPKRSITATAAVSGPTSIQLRPRSGGLPRGLAVPIQLGPLPYGIQLSGVQLLPGRVVVSGARGAGHETLS
jgi:hypothetical protein